MYCSDVVASSCSAYTLYIHDSMHMQASCICLGTHVHGLLYSLIIYEIVNFSFFTLYSLLLLSFFLYLKSVPIYVIVHGIIIVHVWGRSTVKHDVTL